MFRYSLFLFLFLLLQAFPSHAYKDTLFFRNGGFIIGEIKEIQMGVISFDPDDANDITVQLRKLSSIHADTRKFRLETVDHRVLIGKLVKSETVGFIWVVSESDTTIIFLNNISFMYPVEKGLGKRVNGYASAGYSYTRSSELGRINLDFSATYLDRIREVKIYGSAITTIDSTVLSRDNENAGILWNNYFSPKWFAGVLGNYQRNIELGIKKRFQEGAGVGNKLMTRERSQLIAFTGFVLNQETSTEDVYSGVLTEWTAGIRFNIFSFDKPELDLEAIQDGYLSLSQDRYRYDGEISLRWELIEDFDLKLSFYFDYDSNPPGQESANVDYGTVIGLAIEF